MTDVVDDGDNGEIEIRSEIIGSDLRMPKGIWKFGGGKSLAKIVETRVGKPYLDAEWTHFAAWLGQWVASNSNSRPSQQTMGLSSSISLYSQV